MVNEIVIFVINLFLRKVVELIYAFSHFWYGYFFRCLLYLSCWAIKRSKKEVSQFILLCDVTKLIGFFLITKISQLASHTKWVNFAYCCLPFCRYLLFFCYKTCLLFFEMSDNLVLLMLTGNEFKLPEKMFSSMYWKILTWISLCFYTLYLLFTKNYSDAFGSYKFWFLLTKNISHYVLNVYLISYLISIRQVIWLSFFYKKTFYEKTTILFTFTLLEKFEPVKGVN